MAALVTLSARTPALAGAPQRQMARLPGRSAAGFSLADAAYTTQVGRRPFEHRCAIAARDAAACASGARPRRAMPAASRARHRHSAPGVVVMFPGGGAHYPGAGSELLGQPAFRHAVDECLAPCRPRRRMTCAPSCSKRRRSRRRPPTPWSGQRYAMPALVHARIRAGQAVGELGHQARRGHRPQRGRSTSRPLAGVLSLPDALRSSSAASCSRRCGPAACCPWTCRADTLRGLRSNPGHRGHQRARLCIASGPLNSIRNSRSGSRGSRGAAPAHQRRGALASAGQCSTLSGDSGLSFAPPDPVHLEPDRHLGIRDTHGSGILGAPPARHGAFLHPG